MQGERRDQSGGPSRETESSCVAIAPRVAQNLNVAIKTVHENTYVSKNLSNVARRFSQGELLRQETSNLETIPAFYSGGA